MLYTDNSNYDHSKYPIFNIGWLDKSQFFMQGDIDEFFIVKLISIYRREQVNITRSIYPCSFCFDSYDSILDYNGIKLDAHTPEILGTSEIWVPNNDKTKVFACPDLIIHYIKDHSYLPPQEFIEAVNNFDLNSKWSGNEEYKEFLKVKFSPR